MRPGLDDGSLQGGQYWSEVGYKEQRHEVERARFLNEQSGKCKTPPTGNELEAK